MAQIFDPTYYTQRASDSRTPEEIALDKLSPSAVRDLVARAAATDAERGAADQFQLDEKTFRHMYPAYRDTVHNRNAMVHHWTTVFGVQIPTHEQLEASFFALRESGVLQLDANEVAKEDKAAIAARADKIRADRAANEFNEDAAYAMSMPELEAKARGWS